MRRVRVLRAAVAVAAVVGLTSTHALPAMAKTYGEDAAAPQVTSAEVQRLRVSGDVAASPATIGGFGEMMAGNWGVPLRGELRDPYGPRVQRPVAGVGSFHRGQDIGASCGTPIRAAAAGTVVQAGWFGSYGNWVLIDHGNGLQTGYAHDSRALVMVGQTVSAGQAIATVGSTGSSSGCHVHFETRIGSTAVDPKTFMRARGAPLT